MDATSCQPELSLPWIPPATSGDREEIQSSQIEGSQPAYVYIHTPHPKVS
jgi:hypothetical protein